MTPSATPTTSRSGSHVSTWLSFGDLTLTLGKAPQERFQNCQRLAAGSMMKAYPNLHFVKPTINHTVANFGLELAGMGNPPTLWHEPPLPTSYYGEKLKRVDAIPIEERLWCFSVLQGAYTGIGTRIRRSLDNRDADAAAVAAATKTLCPAVTHLLHIDQLQPCGNPERVEFPSDICSDMRQAFHIVVHIHAQSKLAQFFGAESLPGRGPKGSDGEDAGPSPSSSFQPPHWDIGRDPSSWGFEVYSTDQWDQTLQEWDGHIEQTILKRSLIAACDEAVAVIKRGKKHLFRALADKKEEEEEQQMLRLLYQPGGNNFTLDSLSVDVGRMAFRLPSRNEAASAMRLSDKRVMALADRQDDPTALAHQMDYTPTLAIVRGPPPITTPLLQQPGASMSFSSQMLAERLQSIAQAPSSSAALTVSKGIHFPNGELSCSAASDALVPSPRGQRTSLPDDSSFSLHGSASESSSDCSTPRASTPVVETAVSPNYRVEQKRVPSTKYTERGTVRRSTISASG